MNTNNQKLINLNFKTMKKGLLFFVALITCAGTQLIAQDTDFDSNLEESDKKSVIGGFGAELAKKSSFVNFNGYITNEYFLPQRGVRSFDQHYFNVFVSTQINDMISAEGQLEYEHGGDEVQLRYGYADVKIAEEFVIRSGKFLVPAGEFNEYLYPEYLSKTVSRAWVNREISASAWAEVGLQIRGVINGEESFSPFYSVYVVNGLSGDEGAGIRSLRGNSRDNKGNGNKNKAFGLNFGANVNDDLKLSVNYYTGKYTPDNLMNLAIFGFSANYNKDALTIWGEYQSANQEITGGELKKSGYYLLAGYRVMPKLEPLVRYDAIKLDGAPEGDRNRVTLGLNYYLSETAVLKANYELISDDGVDAEDNLFGLQFSVGF